MSKIVIAYESQGDALRPFVPDSQGDALRPFVPDAFFVQEETTIERVTRDGVEAFNSDDLQRLVQSRAAFVVNQEPMPAGHWLSIESFGGSERYLSWFPLAEENTWRATRAKTLVSEAAIQRPLEAIRLLSACAALMKLDIYSLVDELERNRNSAKESLADIFQRVRPAG